MTTARVVRVEGPGRMRDVVRLRVADARLTAQTSER